MAFGIETERMILRDWRVGNDADIDAMHVLGTDPKVMATLGPLMPREATAAMIVRLDAIARELGHTFWAMERRDDGRVIGFCGLIRIHEPHIECELEIGWRMAWDCWGRGFATEAARACIDWAAANRPGEAIYAITAAINRRSRAVMERLGMERDPAMDFRHSQVPAASPLSPHVTYRLSATG